MAGCLDNMEPQIPRHGRKENVSKFGLMVNTIAHLLTERISMTCISATALSFGTYSYCLKEQRLVLLTTKFHRIGPNEVSIAEPKAVQVMFSQGTRVLQNRVLQRHEGRSANSGHFLYAVCRILS